MVCPVCSGKGKVLDTGNVPPKKGEKGFWVVLVVLLVGLASVFLGFVFPPAWVVMGGLVIYVLIVNKGRNG
jgi:hypothetical protein